MHQCVDEGAVSSVGAGVVGGWVGLPVASPLPW